MQARLGLWLGAAALLAPAGAMAACDLTYEVLPGDTIFSVAERHYDNRDQWTLIYYANQALLSGSAQINPGMDLYVPCPAGSPVTERASEPAAERAPDLAAATTRQVGSAELTLLTGGNYAPFTDEAWPQKGLVTDLVEQALAASPAPVAYAITWKNDWSQHLYPLLDEKTYDMGFPWFKPDCDAPARTEICTGFHFSEPLMDVPIMLFKRHDSGFDYTRDADMAGARLCRPDGYSVHDLDRADRRWLSEGTITLMQPESPEACFEALMADQVDAVSVDVFLGATKIVSMGLRGRAVPIDQPLGEEQLHVVISKSHWRGTTHLYRINAGLEALRSSGTYDEIVAQHLQIFWDKLR